jgi:hypothetical protein
MGWYIIMEPSTVKKKKKTAIGQMCIDVFGEDWEEFEIAHLATSDGIGIELFSFPHGVKAPEFNPFNTGLFIFVSRSKYRTSSLKLYLTAANKECLFENIIKDKPLKCAT